MNEQKNRVVVLGSRGFVGSHLVRRLEKDKTPHAPLSSATIDLCSNESVVQLTETLKREDTVVFVSALTPDKGKDANTLIRNLQMANHFSQAIEKSPIEHVVYISSDAVYDETPSLVRESTPLNPNSFHGVMHLARERILIESCAKSKIKLTLLRPTAIYGAGDTHGSYGPNRFLKTAKLEKTISLFGGGEEVRDHVHINDVIDVTVRTIQQKTVGTLNIASGNAVSFRDVADRIASLIPGTVVKTSHRNNPITYRHFDLTHLFKTIDGFKPTDLHTGLSQLVN